MSRERRGKGATSSRSRGWDGHLSMPPAKPTRLDLVMAEWCPHCTPLSVEMARRYANRLGVPLRILDIDDPALEREADRLVLDYGEWTEDYLIPQAFLHWSDGRVEHLLTGIPGPVSGTRQAWERLLEPR